jgi:hypothetical protein
MDIASSLFSSRIVLAKSSHYEPVFKVASNSFWDHVWDYTCSWIKQDNYTELNRKTLEALRRQLNKKCGKKRKKKVCDLANVDLDQMISDGSDLTTRDVEKILVSLKDVSVGDMQDAIVDTQEGVGYTNLFEESLREVLLDTKSVEDLDSKNFAKLYNSMQKPLSASRLSLAKIKGPITGKPTKELACYVHDYFLSVKERLQLCELNKKSSEMAFYERLCKAISYKEMKVGTLVQAHNDEFGKAQFYRVAAKVVTGQGHVSFILKGATNDSTLSQIRVFRGSIFRPAGLDTSSSFVTDFEPDIGFSAFKSGEKYEKALDILLPTTNQIEMGHSLGGLIVEYRAAYHPEMKKAILFNAPGVPKTIVDKFNKQREESEEPFELVVVRVSKDVVDKAGPYSLGYQAPDNVNVELLKFKQKRAQCDGGEVANHNQVLFDFDNDCFELHKYDRKVHDKKFNNLTRSNLEKVRHYVGGYFLSPVFSMVKEVTRTIFASRAKVGLEVESFDKGRWHVEHIKPQDLNKY